jgi:hypothetical protein
VNEAMSGGVVEVLQSKKTLLASEMVALVA